ncbi:hypothetical protein PR202_gb06156 [Eleusine coracana subsp. coracana]|uniref:Uncharacterized protein n=1 Tax=Eleusine coracana subsp. coracana TaxID=191504 RepID=A0AAV5E8Y4_ELECO|nr:hypothetical protein PR202_gb06156 [Eleusine coracana subsp. coracana]
MCSSWEEPPEHPLQSTFANANAISLPPKVCSISFLLDFSLCVCYVSLGVSERLVVEEFECRRCLRSRLGLGRGEEASGRQGASAALEGGEPRRGVLAAAALGGGGGGGHDAVAAAARGQYRREEEERARSGGRGLGSD